MYKENFKIFATQEITGYSDGVMIKTSQDGFTFRTGSIERKKE